MNKKQNMTLEEHKAIAEFLLNPIAIKMACDIPKTLGKTSQASRTVAKFEKARLQLISDMQQAAYNHGHVGIYIYYPIRADV